jgi:integrase
MAEQHTIMGGKVYVYRRDNSGRWQCSTYLAGRNHRVSTKEESLAKAKDFAEDWYLELRGKLRSGELKTEKTFAEAADQFTREFEIITGGQRSPIYVQNHKDRLRVHLVPFFGKMGLSEINPGKVQEYRIHRREKAMAERGAPPARSTLHQEIVVLRQTLKTAIRHGWLQFLPDLSEPYKSSGKIAHRAWFSKDEYTRLYEATRERARKPKNPRYKWESEQLHDFVLFMANTGLRPDEAKRLQFRDVTVVEDDATEETILEIQVRGKRGVGFCKSMSGAVRPFERLQARRRPPRAHVAEDDEASAAQSQDGNAKSWPTPKPVDLIFPRTHRELLNTILAELDLKTDREGQPRTAYSLRHTYICLRLMEGADIYQIAKNCRTSVEMIEKYYASHISTNLNAAAINVRRPKPVRPKRTAKAPRRRTARQTAEA